MLKRDIVFSQGHASTMATLQNGHQDLHLTVEIKFFC